MVVWVSWLVVGVQLGARAAGQPALLRVKAENRERLDRILGRLRGGAEEALCSSSVPYPRALKPVRWLHFPKCGSSFGTTIARHGCPLNESLSLGQRTPEHVRDATSDREDVGPTVTMPVLARYVQRACKRAHAFALDSPNVYLSLTRWGQHAPLSRAVGTDHSSVAAVFRAPNQRLLSAWHFDKHLWGAEFKGPHGTGNREYGEWRRRVRRANAPLEFAETRGVGGCYARMLNDCQCAARPRDASGVDEFACGSRWVAGDDAFLAASLRKVALLGFVGLLEAFNASVCLFHRRFGGDVPPAAFAKHNWSRRRRGPTWDEAALGDHVDPLDELIWTVVLGRFESDLDSALAALSRALTIKSGPPGPGFSWTRRVGDVSSRT